MRSAFILTLMLASFAGAQVTLVSEGFSSGLPSNFTLQSGTGTVAGGVLTLTTGCVQIARPGGNATFSNAQGLAIEADVTIKDPAQGDFIIYSLYDTLPNCEAGPVNGYYAGWYPAGSDNPNNDILKFASASFSIIASSPTSIAANVKIRIRKELLPDGTINTYVNGVKILTVKDTSFSSGLLTLRSWHEVDIDNVLVTTIGTTVDSPFQVKYMSNLNLSDSVINITNTGARGADLAAGTSASTIGALCVNVYTFSPDEQLISCCSCPVTPNGLVSLSARQDLISNTLTPAVPTSIVVKLYASVPVGGSCSASAAAPGPETLGLLAWGTTVHTGVGGAAKVTETPFLPATLSQGERTRITQLCTFINSNGSGFGICRSCRLGGLGAGRL